MKIAVNFFKNCFSFSPWRKWHKGKRLLAFLFLLMLSKTPVWGQNQRLSVSSFNDNWGGGFAEIQDNYRSFGWLVQDDFLLWQKQARAQLVYSGFTDKFSPDSSRLDELMLRADIPLFRVKNLMTFQATGGFIYTGNLGGESFQNAVHGGVGVENIGLIYPETNQLYALLGGRFTGQFPMGEDVDFQPYFYTTGEFFWSPYYMHSLHITLGFGAENKWQDLLKINVGINHQKIYNQPTREVVAQKERGLFLQYRAQLGLATFSLMVVPNQKFSVGLVGINLLAGKHRKSLKTIDAIAEFGAFTKDQGMYQRYLWNKVTRHQSHFQFDLHHQFWRINGSSNPAFPNQYGHFRQISFGGNYHPIAPSPKFQVLPYLSVRVGFKTEKLYSGEVLQKQLAVKSLNAIGEAGLRIKMPADFIHKNCYYGGTAGYSYAAPFYRNTDIILVDGYAFAQAVGALHFGAFVMIDF